MSVNLIFDNFWHFMAVLGDHRVTTRCSWYCWGRDMASASSKSRKVGVR